MNLLKLIALFRGGNPQPKPVTRTPEELRYVIKVEHFVKDHYCIRYKKHAYLFKWEILLNPGEFVGREHPYISPSFDELVTKAKELDTYEKAQSFVQRRLDQYDAVKNREREREEQIKSRVWKNLDEISRKKVG